MDGGDLACNQFQVNLNPCCFTKLRKMQVSLHTLVHQIKKSTKESGNLWRVENEFNKVKPKKYYT